MLEGVKYRSPDTIDSTVFDRLKFMYIFDSIPTITLIIAIITIVICLKKRYNKGIIYTIISYVIVLLIKGFGEPMSGGLMTYNKRYIMDIHYITLSIISIIIQFIPLILALRKKKIKEDEVKKENV